ncbi:MAG: hypothetical protein LBM87_09045 [Ruminococcus sp.]|jgi:alpha-tubulin suppressor-like RCC1 family protein|nr:hypothetical protein [Ruminococcus sp.]
MPNNFFRETDSLFTEILSRFGREIFFQPKLLPIVKDLSPKRRDLHTAFRVIFKENLFAQSIKNRGDLTLFFDKLIRLGIPKKTADEIFSSYATVLGIDTEPALTIVKTVMATKPKRIPQTLSGKFSQCGYVDLSGNLFTWGANEFGSVGSFPDTPESDYREPIMQKRLLLTGIKSVSMGSSHTLALKFDGTLLGFGENRFGGMGFDMPEFCPVPKPIMRGIAYADCGGTLHSYAVKFDGSLINLRTPNSAPILSDVVTVSAGMLHTLCVTSDGSLYAWGENRFGQLGDGTKTSRTTPVFIMSDVIAAYTGIYHSVAIKSDKTLWTWGLIPDIENDGAAEIQQILPICFMSNVVTAAAGELHTLAVKTDGTLWAWGKNFYGQLGDGTTVNRPLPVKITDNVEEVSAGVCCSFCRKKDMSIWSWGLNENCELGDGTEINRLSPVKIK